jgi:WD40 repeat protein
MVLARLQGPVDGPGAAQQVGGELDAATNDERQPDKPWGLEPDGLKEWKSYPAASQPLKLANDNHIKLPRRPAPFFARAVHNGKIYVYDWIRGAEIDDIQAAPRSIDDLALSDDGSLVACSYTAVDQATSMNVRYLDVWSSAKHERVVHWTINGKSFPRIEFLDKRRLVIEASENGADPVILVYDLVNQKAISNVRHNHPIKKEDPIAISPGGRYLASAKRGLEIIDLHAGRLVVNLPSLNSDEVLGCAFSWDGAQLAVLTENEDRRDGLLKRYDVRSGQLLGTAQLRRHPKQSIWRPGLQWTPDDQGVLAAGTAIYNPNNGALLWPDHDFKARRVYGFVDQDHWMVEGEGNSFSIEPYPRQQVAGIASGSDAGAKPIDADLPPLTPRQPTNDVRTPQIRDVAALDLVDPAAPAPKKLGAQPTLLTGDAVKSTLHVLRFAAPASGRAVLNSTAADKTNFLDCINLFDSTRERRVAIPGQMRLAAVSDDASLALTLMDNRIDVWSLEAGKPIASWRVQLNGNDDSVQSGGFVNNRLVFARSSDDRLTVWEIPACRPCYEAPNVALATRSPGGKFLVFVEKQPGTRIIALDAVSGDCLGLLETPKVVPGFQPEHAVWSADGALLAVWSKHAVVCWNLKTGRLTCQYPRLEQDFFPTFGAIVASRFLVTNECVIDLSGPRTALKWFNYSLQPLPCVDAWDGQYWTRNNDRSQSFLTPIDLPSDMLAEPPRAADPLLTPGGTVSLDLSRVGLPEEMVATATAEITRSLAAGDISIAANQPLKFVGESTLKSSELEEVSAMNTMGARQSGHRMLEKSKVTVTRLEMSLKLLDGNGTVVWKRSEAYHDMPKEWTYVGQETAQAAIQRLQGAARIDNAREALQHIVLPWIVYPPETTIPLLSQGEKRRDPAPVDDKRTRRMHGRPDPPPSDDPTSPSDSSRERLLKLLTAEPEVFQKAMRWLPGPKRPAVLTPWGIAVVSANRQRLDEAALFTLPSQTGKLLKEGFAKRIAAGAFGKFYEQGQDPPPVAVFARPDRPSAIARAQELGLSFVLLLKIEQQPLLVNDRPALGPWVVIPRIVDVPARVTGKELPALDVATSSAFADQWTDLILTEIDNNYRLTDLPENAAQQALTRMAQIEKKLPPDVLPALVEVRYYLLRKWINEQRAVSFFVKALGPEGKLLLSDSLEQRTLAIQKLALP